VPSHYLAREESVNNAEKKTRDGPWPAISFFFAHFFVKRIFIRFVAVAVVAATPHSQYAKQVFTKQELLKPVFCFKRMCIRFVTVAAAAATPRSQYARQVFTKQRLEKTPFFLSQTHLSDLLWSTQLVRPRFYKHQTDASACLCSRNTAALVKLRA
jgi:hypothetical protein